MLVKTEIRKTSYGTNLIAVNINKKCEILVVSPTISTTYSAQDDTMLEVSFGVAFQNDTIPSDDKFVPVAYSVRLGGKGILIDATLNKNHKKFSRTPAIFKIILPAGCQLNFRPQ